MRHVKWYIAVCRINSRRKGMQDYFIRMKNLLIYFFLSFGLLQANPVDRPIYVIGASDNPPFEFIDMEGREVGFSLDLFRRAASEKNLKYEIQLIPSENYLKAIEENRADIVVGILPGRVKNYITSEGFLSLDLRISALKKSSISNINDLHDKKIAFTGSRLLFEILRGGFEKRFGMKLIFYENHEDALKKIYDGYYDGMIDVLHNGLSSISDSETRGLSVIPISFGRYEYSFAVKKDNYELRDQINDAFAEIYKSGYYNENFKKWFSIAIYDKVTQDINLYTFAVGAGFIIFLVFFVLNNTVLNRRIRDHTEKLDLSIAELNEAQSRLQESEKKFKTLFEQSPAGLMMVNSEGRGLLFNNTLIEIFGVVNAEELSFINLIPFAGFSREFYEKMKINKNIKHEIEYDFDRTVETGGYKTTRRGKAFLEVTVQKISIDARPDETIYLCQIKDISENKKLMDEIQKSSEQYRLTFEAINDGLWDWDIKSGNVYFNRRIFSMLGYIREVFPQNFHTWIDLIHPDDRDVFNITVKEKIKQNMSFFVEYRMRKKDRSWLWVEGRGQTIEWDSQGNPLRVIGTHTDISRRKEMEHSLIKEKEKALRKEELKTIFLKNVSHEIRTPLNGIIGFAGMLSMDNINRETRKVYSRLIDSNAEQIMNILSDIVDSSIIEKGEILVEKKEFSCNELMQEVYEIFSSKSEKIMRPKVKLLCGNLTDERDYLLYSDKVKIKQVLVNLLSNSFRFTYTGTVEFGYNTDQSEVGFFVSDEGLSMTDDETSNFFDRFNSDPTRGRLRDIGLSIAGDIVEAMGGEISIDTRNREGVFFHFSFPVKERIPDCTQKWEELLNKKVLIADDNFLIYFHLSEFLKSSGIESIYAQDGYEAIDIIKGRDDIDAVLMDMQMPGIDGISSLNEIKKIRSTIPVIIQTGHVRKAQVDGYFAAGCDDVIEKPIDEDMLVNKLIDLMMNKKKCNCS